MSRLAKRVEKLEGGGKSAEVIILGHWPRGCTEERVQEIAEAKARKRGYGPPFKFSAQCTNLPGGEDDICLWFIGSRSDLGNLLRKIGESRNFITPLPGR